MRPSENLHLPPRIYPPFQQLYATLPQSTPLSQNIPPPPFQQLCATLPAFWEGRLKLLKRGVYFGRSGRLIYPSLPEYTPLSTTNTMRPSPPPPRIYPPFQPIHICATLRESTPSSQNIHPFFKKCICAILSESTTPS